MRTHMPGFKSFFKVFASFCFQESLHPCALDESSLSIGRVKLLLAMLIQEHDFVI